VPEQKNSNASAGGGGTGSALAALKGLDLPTAILIIASGGMNFFATRDNGSQLQYQREQVFRQVGELHDNLANFESRQKAMIEAQNKITQSQTQILEHDTQLIKEIHDIAERMNRLRNLDQMRGAPQ
jgi:hypothetical protein